MRSCRICSFFLFVFCLPHVWFGWGGGVGWGRAPFITNESISLPNNHFELQKDKKFSWFLQGDSSLHEICSWWNDCWKTPMKHFQNDMLFWFDLFFFVLLYFCYGLCQLFFPNLINFFELFTWLLRQLMLGITL